MIEMPLVREGMPLPDVDHGPMTADRLEAFAPYYLGALVWAWTNDGSPTALTGTNVGALPGTEDGSTSSVWVITASDPDGVEFHVEENIARHGELLKAIDQEAAGPGVALNGSAATAARWWPAVGAVLDGTHHELSVAVSGITEARACQIGLRFGQLAIFEITDELLRLVPCIAGSAHAERPRHWDEPTNTTVTGEHLALWRHQHDRAALRVGL